MPKFGYYEDGTQPNPDEVVDLRNRNSPYGDFPVPFQDDTNGAQPKMGKQGDPIVEPPQVDLSGAPQQNTKGAPAQNYNPIPAPKMVTNGIKPGDPGQPYVKQPVPSQGVVPKAMTNDYNTTPMWQDPLNPPDPGDPYWGEWHAANPDYNPPAGASLGFNPQALPGWDQSKWNDTTHTSDKYRVGRILSNFAPGIQNLGTAFQEIKKFYPQATWNGKDKITLKQGGETYDLLTNSGSGQNMAWWWGVPSAQGGGGSSAPGAGGPPGGPQPTGGPGSRPWEQTGGGSNSTDINDAIARLLKNNGRISSPEGAAAMAQLNKYISGGGDLNARLESMREKMGLMGRAQMSDARSDLASRGLLSEGSNAQGAELSTLGRVNQNLSQTYSTAARDAVVEDNANMMDAIKTITGLDERAADRLLATVSVSGNREGMMADIALRSLDQNIEWNKFLAEFGLKRDTIMQQLQSGQMRDLSGLIDRFIQWLDSSSGGYV